MKLKEALDKSLVLEETVEIVLFILLFFTIVVQVLFRFRPVAEIVSYTPFWTEELSRWLYIYIVFIGAGVALHRKEHIAIEIFVEKLPYAIRFILGLFIYMLILFCCILFVYFGSINAAVVWHQQSHNIPIFTYGYLYIVVPIAFFLMALRTLGLVILSVMEYKTTKSGGRV